MTRNDKSIHCSLVTHSSAPVNECAITVQWSGWWGEFKLWRCFLQFVSKSCTFLVVRLFSGPALFQAAGLVKILRTENYWFYSSVFMIMERNQRSNVWIKFISHTEIKKIVQRFSHSRMDKLRVFTSSASWNVPEASFRAFVIFYKLFSEHARQFQQSTFSAVTGKTNLKADGCEADSGYWFHNVKTETVSCPWKPQRCVQTHRQKCVQQSSAACSFNALQVQANISGRNLKWYSSCY